MDQRSRPYPCESCDKSFGNSHQLNVHKRVHTNERPYSCSQCGRAFKQLSQLQQHIRIHTGERPYRCNVAECGQSFIQLAHLQQHTRKHFFSDTLNVGRPPKRRTQNRWSSSMHKEAPFRCGTCGKQYRNEGAYKKHLDKHRSEMNSNVSNNTINTGTQSTTITTGNASGVHLWTCSICATVFASQLGLASHMNLMHGGAPICATKNGHQNHTNNNKSTCSTNTKTESQSHHSQPPIVKSDASHHLSAPATLEENLHNSNSDQLTMQLDELVQACLAATFTNTNVVMHGQHDGQISHDGNNNLNNHNHNHNHNHNQANNSNNITVNNIIDSKVLMKNDSGREEVSGANCEYSSSSLRTLIS